MPSDKRPIEISPRDFDAVLFDLDGVLTPTASLHAAAWKQLFDEFLEQWSRATGKPFEPFDVDHDYRQYVDGRPRYDGVAAFLAARGIDLPRGDPDDPPGAHTHIGLGKLKDDHFQRCLRAHGVIPYASSVALVHRLRREDFRTAVVSSSRSCTQVLQAANILDLFDRRVDGNDLDALGLPGKPAPDAFLQAARRLAVEPGRAVVVEDSLAGVQAARAGGFGLIIGVAREGDPQAFLDNGAHVVVRDLDEVTVATPYTAWSLVYHGFDPAHEGIREALCTLGNGYFATRGAMFGVVNDGVHYPGTYLAGGYNRLKSFIEGREVETEDLVNFPNWLMLQFRIDDGPWFDLRAVDIEAYRLELDIYRAMLLRYVRFKDAAGRVTELHEQRLVSMLNVHIAGVELTLTPLNWSGMLTLRSAIDGRVENRGARLYERFSSVHLCPVYADEIDSETVRLMVRTSQSDLRVAMASRLRLFNHEGQRLVPPRTFQREERWVAHELQVDAEQGRSLRIEKVLALFTSRDPAISEAGLAASKAVSRAGDFAELRDAHCMTWEHLWRRFDVRLRPAGRGFRLNVLMLLRLNMLHLLQTASPHSIGMDVGVPARGWTGEAYQGHIFWDELFIFPFFNLRVPEVSRSLLLYRYRRLDEARHAARAAGYRGAMFPWQSASDGQEETQVMNLNPRSLRWVPDNTYLQRHVGSAIAYNTWQYFQVTYDIEFMHAYGAELILEIARFWASMATYNPQRQRYDIRGVMGPDEFHDAYPGAARPGIDNNAYTNVMAAWVLWRALDVLDMMSAMGRAELMKRLNISADEVDRWDDISRRLYIPFHRDGIIISQFEGYEDLKEIDLDAYRARYGNIQRMELILEAENDSANNYKVSKQPDVLMLFYVFSQRELAGIFERLGYEWNPDIIQRNVEYYGRRSSHGSTLSRVVHAWVTARVDRREALRYFVEALQSDVRDIQGGTTREGVHLGAMAGSVDLVERMSTGIEVNDNVLRFNPELPKELDRLEMRIHYRGHSLDIRLTRDALIVQSRNKGVPPIRIAVGDVQVQFECATTQVFPLRHADDAGEHVGAGGAEGHRRGLFAAWAGGAPRKDSDV